MTCAATKSTHPPTCLFLLKKPSSNSCSKMNEFAGYADVPIDQNREGERTVQIAVQSRCVSSACTFARTVLQRPYHQKSCSAAGALPPTAAGQLQLLLPSEYLSSPAAAIASKLAHTCSNYTKMGLTVCAFHPQSSRVATGNKLGELSVWELTNGFRFVKQFAAHQHMNRIHAMEWSHNELYCLTGDHKGYVKCASCSTAWLCLMSPAENVGCKFACHSLLLDGVQLVSFCKLTQC